MIQVNLDNLNILRNHLKKKATNLANELYATSSKSSVIPGHLYYILANNTHTAAGA